MKNSMKLSIFMCLFVSSVYAQDLNFSKSYELALKNAHSIKASEYQVQSTQERIEQEKSMLYPQINFSAYYKKSENSYYDETRESLKQGLINYGVSVKQAIYSPEIYSRIDSEKLKNELYRVGLNLEKKELAQNVFQTYLELLKSYNKVKLNESYLEYTDSKLEELKKKYEMELANKMDLLEMQVEFESVLIDLKKEKKILKVRKLKLEQLIGVEEYSLPIVDLNKDIKVMMEQMVSIVSQDSDFSENLLIRQAKLELDISKKEIKTASSGHYPKLDFEASIYRYDTDDPDVQAPYKETKNAMLVLNVPIYSGGAVSSRIRERELTSKSIYEELLNSKKDVKVQHDEYLALFEAAVESSLMYKNAYDSSLLYLYSVEQGYEHGLKSLIDLNDAKSKQFEVKYRFVENIYEMIDSYIGLMIIKDDFESLSLLDDLLQKNIVQSMELQ